MTKNTFLNYMKDNHGSDNPVLRIFLSDDEKKFANQLVKEGIIIKGISPRGNSLTNGYVQYYMPNPTSYYAIR